MHNKGILSSSQQLTYLIVVTQKGKKSEKYLFNPTELNVNRSKKGGNTEPMEM